MRKTCIPYDPEQQLLPPDQLAYFISDVVHQLVLSAITVRYEEERRVGPALPTLPGR